METMLKASLEPKAFCYFGVRAQMLIVTNWSPREKLWSSRASCFLSWSFGSLNPFGAVTVEDDAGWTCCDETQTPQDKLYFGIHTGHHRRNVVPRLFLNLIQITLFPEESTTAIVAKSRTEFLFFKRLQQCHNKFCIVA